MEKENGFKEIQNKTYIDCANVIAEYVNKILCIIYMTVENIQAVVFQIIRKESIEEYVLTELESRIFNDKAISILAEDINGKLKNQSKREKDKRALVEKELKDIEKQIGNAVIVMLRIF